MSTLAPYPNRSTIPLEGLSDVDASAVTDQDVVYYDAASHKFKGKAQSALSVDTGGLTTAATDRQVPHASGGRLVFRDPAEFDVRDYGAVGGPDDTTAIQSVIDAASAAGGGLVAFSGGATYTVSTLTPKSNVGYTCRNGSVLQHKTGTINPMFYRPNGSAGTLTNVTWRDVRLEGEATALSEDSRMGIYLRAGVSNVKIVDCKANGFPSAAFHVDGLRVHIRGNIVTNCTKFVAGRNAINVVADTGSGSTTGTFGEIIIANNTVDTATNAGICIATIGAGFYVRAAITGNTVYNCTSWAGIVCEANGSAHQVAITGNNVARCLIGIEVANTGGTNPQPADHHTFTVVGNTIDAEDLAATTGVQVTSSYTVVEGNTIRSNGRVVTMGGIDGTHRASSQMVVANNFVVSNTGTVQHAIFGSAADNCTIANNRLIVAAGATSAIGIGIADSNALHVHGNHITGVGRDGISLTSGFTDATVEGNVIYDPNAVNGAYNGITLAGAAGTALVHNNVVSDRRGSPLMKYALDTSGVTTGTVRLGPNHFAGWVTGRVNGTVIYADGFPWNQHINALLPAAVSTSYSAPTVVASQIMGGWVTSSTQGSTIGWDVVLGAGTWEITVLTSKDANRGIFTVSIDGVDVGGIDTYNASTQNNQWATLSGVAVASSGKKRLLLTMSTKNASSSNYVAVVQAVSLRRTA